MLVTDALVFVHVPRTGGSFVRGLLREHLDLDPTAPRYPTHASYEELPEVFRDRRGFCMVRNPWDWYVSWYHHSMRRGPEVEKLDVLNPKSELWHSAFDAGASSFKETVTRACEGRFEHPFAKSAQERDLDLYSEFLRRQVGLGIKRGTLKVGRFEKLTGFLVTYLGDRGLLNEPLRHAIESSPPTNVAEHGPYRDYYDQELRELVGHKARWIIERYRYKF